jgi:hypothetical protein
MSMTLKQAILKLPQIDKRWEEETVNNHLLRWNKSTTIISLDGLNVIDDYVAAAKTIDIMIWWTPAQITKQWTYWSHCDGMHGDLEYKTPTAAIRAAFIAAVQYRLEHV